MASLQCTYETKGFSILISIQKAFSKILIGKEEEEEEQDEVDGKAGSVFRPQTKYFPFIRCCCCYPLLEPLPLMLRSNKSGVEEEDNVALQYQKPKLNT